MLQDDLLVIRSNMSDEELYEESTLKGQFTDYITRRLRWAASNYNKKNKINVEFVEFDNDAPYSEDICIEEMYRKVEVELALKQEMRKLSPKEKEWLLCFLKMGYKDIAEHMDCHVSYTYQKKKNIAKKIETFKE